MYTQLFTLIECFDIITYQIKRLGYIMKFRPHAGSFDESINKLVDLQETMCAVLEHIKECECIPHDIEVSNMIAIHQCRDYRHGWNDDTFLIMVEGVGVIGYTNKLPL